MKLRTAVIGAGSWAAVAHLPALARRPEVAFHGICRRGPRQLAEIADRFGFEVRSEDPAEVLAGGVDIAVVASPARFHHEHAKAALEAGAHVLCEKPMTLDPAEAADLVDTAHRVGRSLLVAFGWNYMPIVEQARNLLAAHPIGELEHVSVRMASPTRTLLSGAGSYPGADPLTVPEAATWLDPQLSGGGYAQAQLSHAFGLLFRLIDEPVAEAFGWMAAPSSAPVELHDAVALRFRNGAVGTVSGGSSHTGAWGDKHTLALHVIGSEGEAVLDLQREKLGLFRPDGTDIDAALPPGAGAYDPFGPADALVDVALGNTARNCAPGALGLSTVEVLHAVYAAAAVGHPVPVVPANASKGTR